MYLVAGEGFWSIQEEVTEPEAVPQEVPRAAFSGGNQERLLDSSSYEERFTENASASPSALTTRVAPMVDPTLPMVIDSVQMLPSMDHSLPVSQEVLDCTNQLHLAPEQEYMRIGIARTLTRKTKKKVKLLELRTWLKW